MDIIRLDLDSDAKLTVAIAKIINQILRALTGDIFAKASASLF